MKTESFNSPLRILSYVFVLALLTAWHSAMAVPSFARQTGQSCVACHAGGQFPELTNYGRLFKLTGYTMGDRGNPLAAMAIVDVTRTRNNQDSSGNTLSVKDGQFILDYGSIFTAGKLTDNLGGFAQFTYANYDNQDSAGKWHGHWGSDNFDLRYARRKFDPNRDFIWGLALNNNPGVQDAWNSLPAWGYPYVSTTQGAFGGMPASTLLEGALAQQVAGVGAYFYLNQHLYAELTSYNTAKAGWSFLSIGNRAGDPIHPLTFLDGSSPYWRLAYTRELGAHNMMVGMFGMHAGVLPFDGNNQPMYGNRSSHYRDVGLDAQYQYILAPHTLTAQFRNIREKINDNTLTLYAGPATLNSTRLKLSYVFRNKYGASLALSNLVGSADSIAYATSANSVPNTRMWTPELFYLPMQNLRLGVQYNAFTRYMGSATNYDGNGRNASDNNTLYVYAWAAF